MFEDDSIPKPLLPCISNIGMDFPDRLSDLCPHQFVPLFCYKSLVSLSLYYGTSSLGRREEGTRALPSDMRDTFMDMARSIADSCPSLSLLRLTRSYIFF